MLNIEDIKKLRDETGASPVEIKKALTEAQGDFEKAREVLKAWGKKIVDKKMGNEANDGLIDFYLHPNAKTGVLLDIRCQTDFVAKSPEFKNLAHEICLHIAAMRPLYVSENDIPQELIDAEERVYREQVADSGKPEDIVKQIIDGKLQKYKSSVSLISQSWVKDDTKTIKNLIEDTVAKVGENIEVKRFMRYEI
jgi:elongation factor Ts